MTQTEEKETLNDQLAKMPLPKIAEYVAKAEADLAHAKLRLEMFNGELTRRFADEFTAAFGTRAAGEKTIVRDDVSLKGEISKRVSYDSPKLMEVASELPWERVRELFKIEFSMPEATYNALAAANPDLYSRVAGARTVKYGDLKVTIKKVASE